MFFFEIKYKSLSDSQNTNILPSTGMNKATKIIISNSHYRWQQAKKKKKRILSCIWQSKQSKVTADYKEQMLQIWKVSGTTMLWLWLIECSSSEGWKSLLLGSRGQWLPFSFCANRGATDEKELKVWTSNLFFLIFIYSLIDNKQLVTC